MKNSLGIDSIKMKVDHLELVKEFDCGLKAFSSVCGRRVSLFAEACEQDGNYFKVSHWTELEGKTPVEIADYIYDAR